MSRILVLGAAGMLGHKVCQALADHDVVGTVRGAPSELERFSPIFDGVELIGGLDVLDDPALRETFRRARPDFVVNCVGLVKQLEEADDAYLAISINSLLPHRLARLCDEVAARLIHISTDCVFDGRRGGYVEEDLTDARDLYGRTKALGETVAGETSALTLRTSFIGRELKPKTHGLVEWFLDQEGGCVDGFSKVIYSGLTSLELASVVRRLIEQTRALTGVFQVASEPITKYDLLRLIRQTYDLEVDIRSAAEPVSDRSMSAQAFFGATGYAAPPWERMVKEMRADPTSYEAWKKRKIQS